ncbi:MAG: SusC/RagA family TonB-linked outer membrane protein [Prevotellaceae bacterium]|nr:SusC/RagA family TonB-linked outer membrane protein [Prevotellaceae bacterium]
MKQFLFIVLCLFVSVGILHAQTRVTGKVTDSGTGDPLPFVTVFVKGTTLGAETDEKGSFSISVPSNATTLVFSLVGYTAVEMDINNRTVIDVVLTSEAISLDQVVVTAMGISREQRAVGYAAQEIKAEALTQTRQTDLNNALVGKVAGVRFWGASGSTFDAGRVVLRGASTLSNSGAGGSDPIYVLDGVITNVNAINMDDVESINVLKGAAATALYGSRGGNGAVIITSKTAPKDRSQFSISQTLTVENVKVGKNYQSQYGGGALYTHSREPIDGSISSGEFNTFNYNPAIHDSYLSVMDGMRYYDMGTDESWGPPLDGREYAPWYAWDPTHPKFGQTAQWTPQPEDNLKDLYKTGAMSTTNIAFARSAGKFSTRVSFTNVNRTGVIDNSSAVRRFFSVNTRFNATNRLSISLDYKYTYRKNHNAGTEGYSTLGNAQYTYAQWGARNVALKDLKDYRRPDGSFRSWNISSPVNYRTNAYHDSPWAIYEEINRDGISQWNVINGNVNYEIIKDKLSIGGTFNGNMRFNESTNKIPNGTTYGSPYTSGYFSLSQYNIMDTQIQGYLSYKDKFLNGKLDVSANLFGETRNYKYNLLEGVTSGGTMYNGYWNFGASLSTPPASNTLNEQKDNSFFGTASIGWDRTYYLEVSLRNDWTSTLPDSGNSYLYGGVSLAANLNNYLKNVQWLDFWKVRASMAQVGSTMSPYQVYEVYSSGTKYGGLAAMTVGTVEYNPNIKPTISTSWEVGTEFKFFKNRLWGDVNFYVKDSKDQIINLPVTPTSGYSTRKMNAGLIRNKGVEISLGGTPIRTKDFEWDLWGNLAFNKNELRELDKSNINLTRYQLDYYGLSSRLYLYAEVGKPLGTIMGSYFETDDNGNRIFDAYGRPVVNTATSAMKELGSIQPDATGGFGTSFSWKGLRLAVSFDFQIGGKVASVSNMYGEGSGILKSTVAVNDRGVNIREPLANGGGIKVEGVQRNTDGSYSPFNDYVSAYNYFKYKSRVWEDWIYDASYLSMREVSLNYKIPQSLVDKLNVGLSGANVSFILQNPWLIHSGVPNVDGSAIGNARYGYIEGGQTFSTRTMGFSINLTF